MKVIAYGIKNFEKIHLARVNLKAHDITVIANDLSTHTVNYASGKNAMLVTNFDNVNTNLLKVLFDYGILLIITWNCRNDCYRFGEFSDHGIKIIHLLSPYNKDFTGHYSESDDHALKQLAIKTIEALNRWQDIDQTCLPQTQSLK